MGLTSLSSISNSEDRPMKQFATKFTIALAIFFIPVLFYYWVIIPNMSGDIGKLGMIPFGKDHEGLEVCWYQRIKNPDADVIDTNCPDSLKSYDIITIGDSFSQFNSNGYQQTLSSCMGCPVANFKSKSFSDVVEEYLILLNNDYIKNGQTVILESVERSFIGRFSNLKPFESYCEFLKTDSDNEDTYHHTPFLNSFFSWIRLSLGYKNPIQHFSLTKVCFTHKRFDSTLHIYNSKWIGDGDILWDNITDEQYEDASQNLKQIIEISEAKGVNLIIMVACDKYDAYEPWIKDNHDVNPTLGHIPQNRRIYSSRECLRNAIEHGTMDVYKLNNTHWSVVGADIVGNDLFEWALERGLL